MIWIRAHVKGILGIWKPYPLVLPHCLVLSWGGCWRGHWRTRSTWSGGRGGWEEREEEEEEEEEKNGCRKREDLIAARQEKTEEEEKGKGRARKGE